MPEPERTCISCAKSAPKGDLLRFVLSKSGEPAIDFYHKLEGRGFYICPEKKCLKNPKMIKGIGRKTGLKGEYNPDDYIKSARLFFAARLKELLNIALKSGGAILGYEAFLKPAKAGEISLALLSSEKTGNIMKMEELCSKVKIETIFIDGDILAETFDRQELSIVGIKNSGISKKIAPTAKNLIRLAKEE